MPRPAKASPRAKKPALKRIIRHTKKLPARAAHLTKTVADILSRGKITADGLAWHQLGPEHVSTLRDRLQKLYAPSTANRYLTALRAVLKEAWRLGLVDREPVERALDFPSVKGSRELRGRAVLGDELRAVFAACADTANPPVGIRDAAILALLYGGGLHRAEVAGLELDQFDAGTAQYVSTARATKPAWSTSRLAPSRRSGRCSRYAVVSRDRYSRASRRWTA